MCSERDSPLEPFVLPAPDQPELARLICGAHLGPPVLTRKQKRPRVNSLVCDRAAAFCAAGPPEVLSRMSRPVMQAAERERELARARSQRLNQAAPSLPGESVSRGFADRDTISIRTIFCLNSLNIKMCVSQRSQESNGVGLHVVMRITSHNYDVTNVCPDSIVCAWQPPAGLPTTPFKIKYVHQT